MYKFAVILFMFSALLQAQPPKEAGLPATEMPRELKDIGITEKLGEVLDPSLMVKNEEGQTLPLSSFFQTGQPVILSLVYYSCPGLCNFHLNGLVDGLKELDWSVGQKFTVLVLSFDGKEDAQLAKAKKVSYMEQYKRPGTETGFHFLTASPEVIEKITQAVGFKFKWDDKNKEWAHASAATILTAEGKISRYLHGIVFTPQDLKLALMEASMGKIGNLAEKLVWYCFKYDTHKSKYTLVAMRLMQVGGGFIVLLLGIVLIPFWMRARKEQLVTKLSI